MAKWGRHFKGTGRGGKGFDPKTTATKLIAQGRRDGSAVKAQLMGMTTGKKKAVLEIAPSLKPFC